MKIIKGILLALFLLIPCNQAFAEPAPDGKVQDIQKQVDANKEVASESQVVRQPGNADGSQQGGYVSKEDNGELQDIALTLSIFHGVAQDTESSIEFFYHAKIMTI